MSAERAKWLEKFKPLRIIVVGDRSVGKTSLLFSFTQNSFPEERIPALLQDSEKIVNVDGADILLTLRDTTSQRDYENLTPLSYPKTDCCILCYDINNRSSFNNTKRKWIKELRFHCPKSAIILVGTKSDLRESTEPTNFVTEAEGKKMRVKIKATGFLQCSAKTRDNLDSVFVEAVRAVNKKTNRRKMCCQFL